MNMHFSALARALLFIHASAGFVRLAALSRGGKDGIFRRIAR
jgi:hypothetical protein